MNFSETPLGQLPLLEIDGKIYYQSQAIGRLIAKRNNLAGSNDEEAYHADVIVDSIADLKLCEFVMVNYISMTKIQSIKIHLLRTMNAYTVESW